ncbi:MAG: hypothetical protein N4A35_01145 [Flavobacteriales bacterium]|jgi:outer membrane lipoprotein-sorting protein|nr:hypothetical protein [Flavobacteriales bacterium]
MNKSSHIVSLFASLLFVLPFKAQKGFAEHVKEVYQSYKNTERFQTDITIQVLNFREDPVIQKAKIKKDGNRFHYSLEDKRMLINEKYMITLDKQSEQIIVASALSEEVMNMDLFGEENMNAAIEKVDSIIDHGTTKGIQKYSIIAKNNLISKMEISIDTRYKMLSEVVYYYDESAGLSSTKVIIQYKNITTSPTFSSTEFKESKYISFKGKTISPASAYRNYEVIEINEDVFND